MKLSSVFAERASRIKCDLQEDRHEVPLLPGNSEGQQTGGTHVDTNLLFIAAKSTCESMSKTPSTLEGLPSNFFSLFALVIKHV